jgi:hypothetical protein
MQRRRKTTDLENEMAVKEDNAAHMPVRYGRIGAWLKYCHPDWITVEAKVTECRSSTMSGSQLACDPKYFRLAVSGYAVSFTYVVNGKTFEGMYFRDKPFHKGQVISVRCNPRHPERNDTLESSWGWTTVYTTVFCIAMVLVLLYSAWSNVVGH